MRALSRRAARDRERRRGAHPLLGARAAVARELDTGRAVASFRLVPTPYPLDPNLPAPGTPVPIPPSLKDQVYVSQGSFGLGSHAGMWAYDLNQVDSRKNPDANSPSSNLGDYYRFGKPIYAALPGTVISTDVDNADLPPRSSASGNPNFVYMGARRCTVIGAPHACEVLDVSVIRRKLATPSLAPGIAQVCPAALGS